MVDALVEAGLAKSKGEARRIISQGGAYVNNRRDRERRDAARTRRPGQRIGHGAADGEEELRPAAVYAGNPGHVTRNLQLRTQSRVPP